MSTSCLLAGRFIYLPQAYSSHVRIPVDLSQCLDDLLALVLPEHALIVDVREGGLEHCLGFHDVVNASTSFEY